MKQFLILFVLFFTCTTTIATKNLQNSTFSPNLYDTSIRNPFITNINAINGIDPYYAPSVNDIKSAEVFLKNSHLFDGHLNDIRYFFYYSASINSYSNHYNKEELNQLLKRFIESFKIIPINDNTQAINQYTYKVFNTAVRTIADAQYENFITPQDTLDLIAIRNKNGFGKDDSKSIRFRKFKANTIKLINFVEQVTFIHSEEDKLKWAESNTSKKEAILRTLDISQESITWLSTTLFKNHNKRINQSILHKLGENLENFPKNKSVILNFLSNNQSYSYLKIGRKYLGDEIIDAIFEE
ncbi:MAG: hypothetical protein HRU38_05160 [Saccharospirillaceae bacterium]|nr:hypothetical protein [Pseudomonadales bacterium]NRB78046.1 hypothetical protein [Saccharospirillaceae bacterium]